MVGVMETFFALYQLFFSFLWLDNIRTKNLHGNEVSIGHILLNFFTFLDLFCNQSLDHVVEQCSNKRVTNPAAESLQGSRSGQHKKHSKRCNSLHSLCIYHLLK